MKHFHIVYIVTQHEITPLVAPNIIELVTSCLVNPEMCIKIPFL